MSQSLSVSSVVSRVSLEDSLPSGRSFTLDINQLADRLRYNAYFLVSVAICRDAVHDVDRHILVP